MNGEERFVGDREWSTGVRKGGEIEVSLLFSVLLLCGIFLVCKYAPFRSRLWST